MRRPSPDVVFAAVLLPVMLVLSRHFGTTWDENRQHQYGELVYRYFASGFKDQSVNDFKDLYLYGGMFDTICVIAAKWIPTNVAVLRHLLTSFVGWIGIVYTGRLAKLWAGPTAGLLAMVLLVLSPRYFGDAMNNPKDVPFAAAAVMATFYMAQAQRTYPYFRWQDAAKLTIAIALAINVRAAGGILFLGYVAVQLATLIALDRDRSVRKIAATAGRFALIGALSLCLGTIFWPWAQPQPFTRPFEALSIVTRFPYSGTVLYQGHWLHAMSLPRDYSFLYYGITTPPVVLAGLALSIWVAWQRPERERAVAVGWTLFLFPLAYVALRNSTLYDGIRQLLFAYPPAVVTAAIGWTSLRLSRRGRLITAAALLVGLSEPLVFQIRNHPNQIVYFNFLVGGPAGAQGKYDLDYWGNSFYQAMAWLDGIAQKTGLPLVVSSSDPEDAAREDTLRFHTLSYAPPRSGKNHFHVELVLDSPERMTALLHMPYVYAVRMADGTPLCLIQPGPFYAEIEARLRR